MRKYLGIFLLAGVVWGASPDFDRASKLYQLTEFQQSLEVLHSIPTVGADTFALIGKNYYGLGDFKKSTEWLEKATAREPDNSDYQLLG